jgi:protein phosphatase
MAEPTSGSVIHVTAYGRSDRGRVRASNQDRLLLVDLTASPGSVDPGGGGDRFTVGPLEFALGRAGAVLMVADGMGGRAGGERASARAVTAVAETMVHGAGDGASPQNFVRRLGEALDSANRMIHDEGMSADAYRGMGTTATLAGLLGGNVYVAQVGDSRAYLARGGELTRLTRDQSLVQDMIDMGILSEEEAQSVPSNQILQALGVAPTVEPAVTYHELRRGDLLLLCSDGLSGVVSDAELRGAVADATECAAICDRLVALANERGGPDNITVIAARIDGDGIETATTRDRIVARRYPGS